MVPRNDLRCDTAFRLCSHCLSSLRQCRYLVVLRSSDSDQHKSQKFKPQYYDGPLSIAAHCFPSRRCAMRFAFSILC